jgi:hypothetical protein
MAQYSGTDGVAPDDDSPFTEEADGTVWLNRADAQPVKVLDRELREGEKLGMEAGGVVWLTTPDLRVIRLMRVGEDGPPTDVTLLLEPDDPRIDFMEIEGRPPELSADPPAIEDWCDHSDPVAVHEPKADLRGLVTLDELATISHDDWLIEGLLIEGETAVLYGEPKVGKTFAAIDMALSIATGRDFHGRPTGRPRPVIYVIGEGNPRLFQTRCEAWLSARNISRRPRNFHVLPAPVDMTDRKAVAQLADDIIATIGGQAALVFLDTLARMLPGDENSAADMGRFVAGCGDLRRAARSIGIVHHEGKTRGRGPMGHQRLRGAVDAIFYMEASKGASTLTAEEMRHGPSGAAMRFRLRPEGGSAVLECITVSRDETDAEFQDFQDDATADRSTRVRRLAATMEGKQKGDVIAAVAAMLRVSDKPARDALAEAIPTGFDHAVELDGARLWLERVSGRSTVMRSEPVEG